MDFSGFSFPASFFSVFLPFLFISTMIIIRTKSKEWKYIWKFWDKVEVQKFCPKNSTWKFPSTEIYVKRGQLKKKKEYPAERSRIMHGIENLISLWSSSINNGVKGKHCERESSLKKKRRKREKDSPFNSKSYIRSRNRILSALRKKCVSRRAWDTDPTRLSSGLMYFQTYCQEQTRLRRLFSAKTKKGKGRKNRRKKSGYERRRNSRKRWRPYTSRSSDHFLVETISSLMKMRVDSPFHSRGPSAFSWIDVIPVKSFVSLTCFLSPLLLHSLQSQMGNRKKLKWWKIWHEGRKLSQMEAKSHILRYKPMKTAVDDVNFVGRRRKSNSILLPSYILCVSVISSLSVCVFFPFSSVFVALACNSSSPQGILSREVYGNQAETQQEKDDYSW